MPLDEKQKIELRRAELKNNIKDRIEAVIAMELENAKKPKVKQLATLFTPESFMFIDN